MHQGTDTTASVRGLGLAALGALLVLGGCATTRPAPAELPVPVAVAPPPAVPTPALEPAKTQRFEATAYSIKGRTASGQRTRDGVVAADPKVLPLGTRIRVSEAGSYSGEYTVTDTGRTIVGREIDIYIANDAEAKRFGRRNVQVEVLELGSRTEK